MLRAVILGFLAGPVLQVAAALLWSTAGLALLITIGVLFGALVVVVLAVAAAGQGVNRQRAAADLPAPRRLPGNSTLTWTASAVRVTTRENLANAHRWRQAFIGWRYGPRD